MKVCFQDNLITILRLNSCPNIEMPYTIMQHSVAKQFYLNCIGSNIKLLFIYSMFFFMPAYLFKNIWLHPLDRTNIYFTSSPIDGVKIKTACIYYFISKTLLSEPFVVSNSCKDFRKVKNKSIRHLLVHSERKA